MRPKEVFVIAADDASDHVAAEMILAIRHELSAEEAGYGEDVQPLHASLEPRFFGIGGHEMERARLEPLGRWINRPERALIDNFFKIALAREPDVVLCVGDHASYGRLANSIKSYIHSRSGTFCNWQPILVQANPSGTIDRGVTLRNFNSVIIRHEQETPFDFATRATHTVVELMKQELASFPLKAYLGS